MAAMSGWLSEASSCASRRKRAEPLGIVRYLGGEHLERDLAPELRVGGTVDLTHAAGADRGGDPVVRERLADQGRFPPDLHETMDVIDGNEAGWPVDSTAPGGRRPRGRRWPSPRPVSRQVSRKGLRARTLPYRCP